MAALGNQSAFFEAMLSVVHAGDDDTADVAWDLLSSVPTNIKIKKAIRSLAGTIAPVVQIPGQFFTDEEELGVLHDDDTRLADALLAAMPAGLAARRNEPYGPADGVTHTLRLHALPTGRRNVMIEIRNDLIADEAGIARFAALLSGLLAGARAAA